MEPYEYIDKHQLWWMLSCQSLYAHVYIGNNFNTILIDGDRSLLFFLDCCDPNKCNKRIKVNINQAVSSRALTNFRREDSMSTSARDPVDAGSVPQSSRNNSDKVPSSARPDGSNTARSVTQSARLSARSNMGETARTMDPLDSCRSTMSTSRVHTALAALTAEKNALEARLAKIDSSLELEKRKNVSKLRK